MEPLRGGALLEKKTSLGMDGAFTRDEFIAPPHFQFLLLSPAPYSLLGFIFAVDVIIGQLPQFPAPAACCHAALTMMDSPLWNYTLK